MIKLTEHMAILRHIESRDNQRLIDLRKVRDGRDLSRMFVEGVRLVDEAVRSGLPIEECYVSESFDAWERFPELRRLAYTVSDRTFRSIADTNNPQGIITSVPRRNFGYADIESRLTRSDSTPVALYFSEVNNPANAGAVIRAAEAAGAAGILLSPGSADPYSAKALRAAMGSAFRLPIVTGVELGDAIEWSARNHLNVAALAAGEGPDYTEVDWTQPHLLVFGSEGHGMSAARSALIHEWVHIPMENTVESLNLAVSAGVVLFEARRQNNS